MGGEKAQGSTSIVFIDIIYYLSICLSVYLFAGASELNDLIYFFLYLEFGILYAQKCHVRFLPYSTQLYYSWFLAFIWSKKLNGLAAAFLDLIWSKKPILAGCTGAGGSGTVEGEEEGQLPPGDGDWLRRRAFPAFSCSSLSAWIFCCSNS